MVAPIPTPDNMTTRSRLSGQISLSDRAKAKAESDFWSNDQKSPSRVWIFRIPHVRGFSDRQDGMDAGPGRLPGCQDGRGIRKAQNRTNATCLALIICGNSNVRSTAKGRCTLPFSSHSQNMFPVIP